MTKLLTIEDRSKCLDVPEELAKKIAQVDQLLNSKKYDEALELSEQFVAEDDAYELKKLKSTCLILSNKLLTAKNYLKKLIKEYPEEPTIQMNLGTVYYMLNDYSAATKQFEQIDSSKEYIPFYYNTYGDVLFKQGKTKEAREIFYQEIEHYLQTDNIPSAKMLEGTFQNVLLLDIILANQEFNEDAEIFYQFLDKIEVNDEMQERLINDISIFGEFAQRKWYRPLYRQFVDKISDKGYLDKDKHAVIFKAAYLAIEVCDYDNDTKIDMIISGLVDSSYELTYNYELSDDDKQEALIVHYNYLWSLSKHFSNHQRGLAYLQDNYSRLYHLIEPIIMEISKDSETYAKKVLNQIKSTQQGWSSDDEIEKVLEYNYQKLLGDKKIGHLISSGEEPYVKQTKVGRNDPCPCGSGKKYKKCCGR